MLSKEFEEIIDVQIGICRDTLGVKAEEYASDIDRLHNFRVAAKMQNCTMQQALGGMMAKHTVSIYDLISTPGSADFSVWDEKIKDHINYLLLLKAILVEQYRSEEKVQTLEAKRA